MPPNGLKSIQEMGKSHDPRGTTSVDVCAHARIDVNTWINDLMHARVFPTSQICGVEYKNRCFNYPIPQRRESTRVHGGTSII